MSKDMVPMASSQFYDINGDLISTVDSEEDRIPVSISKVPLKPAERVPCS